ncbi:MAG TPA: glycosyltransferase [Candidatus Eisenbacteria bacterium]|jgi:predicted glycosyltransferase
MHSHWLLYSYDALGLGHARRMTGIARAVLPSRPDVSALLVTCSPQIDALPVPAGLDYVKLPSARKLSTSQYVARTMRLEPDRLRDLRATILEEVARSFQPDFFLCDKSPCGLMGELAPTLDRLRTESPNTRMVLGWRDILDAPAQVRAEWRKNNVLSHIDRWYDEVWVFGDPALFDVREEYDLPRHVADRVRYVGYLSPRVSPEAVADARAELETLAPGAPGTGPIALVTVGGGEDGETLIARWIAAARAGLLPRDLRSVVVTGPMMPEDAQMRVAAAAPASVTVTRYIGGLEAYAAAADLVVGMCGYNTSCEVLGARTPAVMVPRASQRDEQRMRAVRLAERGLVETVDGVEVTPELLASAAGRALARGRRTTDCGLALDGYTRVAREVERVLPARPAPSAAVLRGLSA